MRRRLSLGLLCLTLAACARQADIIVTGGMVWTGLSNGAPQKGAVALANGKILAVGDSAQIARYAGPKTQAIQADGGLVLPGFTDGHTHFIDGGFQLASVDLRNAATPKEFIRRIKDYAKTLKPGEWITGGDWDHTLWPGQPLPHHEWIDSVTPSNPVFVNRLDGHEALANAAAMRAAAVTKATPTPSGGEILRDPRTGETVSRSGRGDDWVKIGGLKGYMDGSAGSRTAYFFEPYSDSAGYNGLLQHPEADMRTWIGSADSAGLQVAVHAIGDRANAILLSIYDSVTKAHGRRDRRFRVEHAQHLRPQDIPVFGMLGVIASVQPYHAIDDGRWVEQRIGPVRIRTTYPFRTLLDTGAKLAFGSDWTVAPLDPILGVYAAVTRRTLDGKNPNGWVPEQKISVGEALRAYTAGNAYATFDEGKRGTLAPGADADVVVLDRNLFTIPPDSLDRARVRYTIVGGRVVYRR